ncbi:hypothetical protein Bca4012_002181 [Brassica carinata]
MAKQQLLMLGIRASFHTLSAVLVAGVIFTTVFLSRKVLPKEHPQSDGAPNVEDGRDCNLFEGKWVFDNESNPIYKEEECKLMSDQLACEKFGRQDSSYKFWRWQPHTCNLPRMPHIKTLWGSFETLDGTYKEVEMVRVYEMALQTLSQWLEVHVNSNRTKLFFMSMSPTHERAEEWGGKTNQNCYGETSLIDKEGYNGRGSDPKMMRVVENVLDGLKRRGLNMHMINITQLSEYRKDGHPSIYRKQWEQLKEDQVLDPSSYSDCIHWCLPGVPDVWNHLLYAYIVDNHHST